MRSSSSSTLPPVVPVVDRDNRPHKLKFKERSDETKADEKHGDNAEMNDEQDEDWEDDDDDVEDVEDVEERQSRDQVAPVLKKRAFDKNHHHHHRSRNNQQAHVHEHVLKAGASEAA
ncbi:hypothetical protein BGZ72_001687 [Mortierella alpina]|nr:hypothetical protein BGZ72_001687 [Mortierella alpina]